MVSGYYVPGDHEQGLARDVVLAPPTCCCCCCCCCTLAAPEIMGGRKFARETEEAYAKVGVEPDFWDAQLSFAAGALLFNLFALPIAGLVGVFAILATAGVYAFIVPTILVVGVLMNTVRLGKLYGDDEEEGARKGFLWGLALVAILAAMVAAEAAIVVGFMGGDVAISAAGLVVGAAIVAPIIVMGLKRRREAREMAEELPAASPPPSEGAP